MARGGHAVVATRYTERVKKYRHCENTQTGRFGEKEQKQFAPRRASTVTNSTYITAGEVATTNGKQLILMVPMLPY